MWDALGICSKSDTMSQTAGKATCKTIHLSLQLAGVPWKVRSTDQEELQIEAIWPHTKRKEKTDPRPYCQNPSRRDLHDQYR
jgi:hypothetical protein